MKKTIQSRLFASLSLLAIAGLTTAQADSKTDLITGYPRQTIEQKEWIPGKKVAVCFILHLETWGVGMGPNLRADLTDRKPDLVNEAFRQYGINIGIERASRVFLEEGSPVTASLSAVFPAQAPDAWKKFRELMPNTAIIAHGMNNSTQQLPLGHGWAKQAEYIKATLDLIEKETGTRPKGWSSPSVCADTDSFRAEAASGLTYSLDAMDSDYLSVLTTPAGKLELLPYVSTTVDMGQYFQRYVQPDQLETLWIKYVSELSREAEKNPDGNATFVTIGIHPFIVGTPDGAAALRETLEAFKKLPNVWVTDTDAVAKASNSSAK